MKYDLIIDGVTIPGQVYKDGATEVAAGRVLEEILEHAARTHLGYRHVGKPGTHAVAVHWDRVRTVQVRVRAEEKAPDESPVEG